VVYTKQQFFNVRGVVLKLNKKTSDSNLILGISAAYYIIANAKKKIPKKKRSKRLKKNYFKTRNFDIKVSDLLLVGRRLHANVQNKFLFVIKNDRA